MSRSILRGWALAFVVVLVGCRPGQTQSPPQFLPITAQWCLEGPAPSRHRRVTVPSPFYRTPSPLRPSCVPKRPASLSVP